MLKILKEFALDHLPYLRFIYHKSSRPIRSFAQGREDFVIRSLIGPVRSFIDIGAHDGISLSNTYIFALDGARGICFEPIAESFQRLNRLYWLNKKVLCIHEGVSDSEQCLEISVQGVLSSFSTTRNLSHSKWVGVRADAPIEQVVVRPLSWWLSQHPEFKTVDLFSLDVEGHEVKVLQGIPFGQFQAKCFVVETHICHSELKQEVSIKQNYQEIADILHRAGYTVVLHNWCNSFWIRNDLVDMLQPKIDIVVNEYSSYRKAAP